MTVKEKWNHAIRITTLFLFSGHVIPEKDKQPAGKKPKRPVYNNLDPVADQIVFASGPNENVKTYMAFRTNAWGQMYRLRSDFTNSNKAPRRPIKEHYIVDTGNQPVKRIGAKLALVLPPKNLVMYCRAAKDDDWIQSLSGCLEGLDGVELVSQWVTKANLRKPYPKPQEDGAVDFDKAYREWYHRKSDTERFHAFVMPKTRGIVLMFSDRDFERAEVQVWPPNRSIETDKPLSNLARIHEGTIYAAVFGTPEQLPLPGERSPGEQGKLNLYTIKVSLPKEFPDSLLRNRRMAEEKCYYLKEHIRFGIRNPAGEYDVVNADPISLEESMLTQFPGLYADKIKLARRQEGAFGASDNHNPGPEGESKPVSIDKPLQAWAKGLVWSYDKAKMTVGLVNTDQLHKRAKVLLDVIYNELGLEDYFEFRLAKHSIDLVYGGKKLVDGWRKLIIGNLVSVIKSRSSPTEWAAIKSGFMRADWLDRLKLSKEHLVYEIKGLEGKSLEGFRDLVVGKRREGLAEMAHKMGKTMDVVDVGLACYQAVKSGYELFGLYEKDEELRRKLNEFCKEYRQWFSDYPSREGIGSIERYRALSVASRVKIGREAFEMLNQVIDASLGMLALVPAANAAAGLMMAVKKTGEMVYDLISMLDEAVSDSFEQVMEDLSGATDANCRLGVASLDGRPVENRGREALELQFRIRAEVLLSLARLLLRSALDPGCRTRKGSLDIQKYQKKLVDEYMLDDFLQFFVFNDGWEYAVKPLVPIRLDTYWLSLVGAYGHFQNREERRRQLGFDAKAPDDLRVDYPNAMYIYARGIGGVDRLTKINVEANFQKTFPVHTAMSRDAAEFADAFEMTYDGVKNHDIAYAQAYYRSGYVDPEKSQDPDLGWKPVEADTRLSPFDHVRVIVVLDAGLPRKMYPMSLQVCRIDTCPDLKGPVYKGFVEVLDEELLGCERGIPDRNNVDIQPGRLGCVLYPFYHFGNLLLAGLKPFGYRYESHGIAWRKKKSMQYEFRIKAGGGRRFRCAEAGSRRSARGPSRSGSCKQSDPKRARSHGRVCPKDRREALYQVVFAAGRAA